MPTRSMKRTKFWFDGGRPVEGWTDGDEWNGWGVPLFDGAQLPDAIRALKAVGFQVEHRGSMLYLTHKDDDHTTEYKSEKHGGKSFWRIDGLTWNHGPSTTRRAMAMRARSFDTAGIARRANDAAAGSRKRGAPFLNADSGYETLRDWLIWNDPNGIWGFDEEFDEAELDLQDLWRAIDQML